MRPVRGGGRVARRRRKFFGIRVMIWEIWDHSGGGSPTGGGPFGEGDRVRGRGSQTLEDALIAIVFKSIAMVYVK